MSTNVARIEIAIQNCATRFAPEDRVTVFEVESRTEDGSVTVTGVVETEALRERVREWTTGVESYDLAVCEHDRRERAVAAPVVPVRGAPDSDAEQVTQVLYGAAVTAFDERGDWTRVRVPDGYVGWMETDSLAERAGPDFDAVLLNDVDGLYAGTGCRIEDGNEDEHNLVVAFQTGETRTVPADPVRSNPAAPTGEQIVEAARRYSGTEYLWGGMTTDGIDCSGLVWMSYRLHGVTLPRDADQQSRMGRPVEREDLQAGDLLFFPGHVAISLGGERFIHAYGGEEAVVENSLDPDDADYLPDLDEGFERARRLFDGEVG